MGRALGAYDADELDRPDLNKCPDCGCFFATDACTLCGKICPEEMRAGHRAPVKKKKKKSTSGRVQFIPWYHTWPAMIIISFFMPIVGIILFFTSPYSKKVKIIVVSICVLVMLLYTGVGAILLRGLFDGPLVNDRLSRAEYMAACEDMSAADLHHAAYEEGAYVTLDLVVVERGTVYDPYEEDAVYYVCADPDGGNPQILLRDCILEGRRSYVAGDLVRVYGEIAGFESVTFDREGSYDLPCLYIAYCDLIG